MTGATAVRMPGTCTDAAAWARLAVVAARMLGVSRRALYRRLERLELGATIARRRRGSAMHASALSHDADGLADRRGDRLMGGLRVAARK